MAAAEPVEPLKHRGPWGRAQEALGHRDRWRSTKRGGGSRDPGQSGAMEEKAVPCVEESEVPRATTQFADGRRGRTGRAVRRRGWATT